MLNCDGLDVSVPLADRSYDDYGKNALWLHA
jgi:hypothetical protein